MLGQVCCLVANIFGRDKGQSRLKPSDFVPDYLGQRDDPKLKALEMARKVRALAMALGAKGA